jgi:hypothetical protein
MPIDPTSELPTPDEIARLAYSRYEARGKVPGFDVEDWLAAEQEARLRQSGIPAPQPDGPEPVNSPTERNPVEASRSSRTTA